MSVLHRDLHGCVSNTLSLMVTDILLQSQNTNGSITTIAKPAFLTVN